MKKFILTTLLVSVAGLTANAGHWHHGPYRHHGSSVSFYFGGYPSYCSPWYSGSYVYYPRYSYGYSYPVYSSGYDYGYDRPNYAVGGTLLGALAGGIIGHNVNRQGWEGAGIGAAAGLVLGGIAESNARARERAVYSTPPAVYSQSSSIPDAPTVNDAPTVPAARQIQNAPTYQPVSSMSGANSLFGR